MRSYASVFICAVFAAFFVPSAQAAEVMSCAGQEKLSAQSAKEALQSVQKRYSDVASIRASFYQDSFLQALEISESSSGEVWFEKPGKMRWDYEKPEKQFFVLNDQTLWFYQKEQQQAFVDRLNQVVLSDLPVAFLLGIGDLARDFVVKEACRTDDGIVFDLAEKPKGGEGEGALKGFQLLVDKKSFLPLGARITDAGENVTSILLRELQINQPVDAARFIASFPSGTDIQDRREERKD